MNTLGRFSMVGAAALLVCAAAASAAPSSTGAYPQPAVAAAVVMGDHYPARRTPFPGGVTGFADVKYAELPGFRPLTLDVYVPPGARSKAVPLVLYIHGGGWEFGHSRQSGA
ncbi:MAG: carboxylesterase family protein, partial [Gammaproteobacteria bacterium]|nr:carboxylesterase family protein [Gammaproteobacteria bacterium]